MPDKIRGLINCKVDYKNKHAANFRLQLLTVRRQTTDDSALYVRVLVAQGTVRTSTVPVYLYCTSTVFVLSVSWLT
jgi:hypothetical protein